MDFDIGTVLAVLNFLFANKLFLGGTVGLFVGWNLPQPAFAKAIQDKVVGWFSALRKK
jgi:hypothetical protein